MQKIVLFLVIVVLQLTTVLKAEVKDKIYIGGSYESYNDGTVGVLLGYEYNDFWDIQLSLPFDADVAFLEGLYKFKGDRKGVYAGIGVGGFSNLQLKPSIGYAFELKENLVLRTEVNSYIIVDGFEQDINAKVELMYYL